MSDRRNAQRTDAIFDKLPPHSLDAERCALAAMMLDKEFAIEAVGLAQPESFFLTDHAIIFDALTGMANRGRAIDAVLLKDELKASGQLEAIGGGAYIAQILASVPSAAHGRDYLSAVIEAAGLRTMIRLADEIHRRAYARQGTAVELAESFAGDAVGVMSRGGADKIVSMAQAVEQYRVELNSDAPRFVPTGLAALDAEIGGLRLGQMAIIGSRPSVGKTSVAKNILRNVGKRGIRCGIVSIEEQRAKIVENEAAAVTGIDNRIISNRAMSHGQRAQVEDALDDIAKLPVYIADEPVRLDEVVAAVTAMAVRQKCQVIIVDHLHLIGIESRDSRADQIREISGALKATFKRMNVAGVVLCQLNREGVERPKLTSLREGGALEQDGDVIVMLHSEDYRRRQQGDPMRDHKLEFLLQKNKGGRCADLQFYYDPATFTITDWDEGPPATIPMKHSPDDFM